MKRLTAFICAAALALSATPVFANPSIKDVNVPALVDSETEYAIVDGTWFEIQELNTDKFDNADVAKAVSDVNDPDKSVTVADTIKALKNYFPDNYDLSSSDVLTITNEDDTKTAYDLKAYNFTTKFANLVLTDGTNVWFDDNGTAIPAKVTMAVEPLKGVSADDLGNYLVAAISPVTGVPAFAELDADSFDSDKGEVTVDFPFLGAFALIQK